MQKQRILRTISRLHLLSTVGLTAIFVLSLGKISGQEGSFNIPHLDKIAHFIMYFFYALVFALEDFVSKHSKRGKPTLTYLKTATLALLAGVLIEWLQAHCTDYRSAEFWDVLADAAGVVTALITAEIIRRAYLKRDRSSRPTVHRASR
ncbi:MAG: VanZ family protein [Bacteroidales bacterium]|jgi:VanZ family protein